MCETTSRRSGSRPRVGLVDPGAVDVPGDHVAGGVVLREDVAEAVGGAGGVPAEFKLLAVLEVAHRSGT